MYYETVSQCIASLAQVGGWVDKAQQTGTARNFDVGVLMTSRLASDMQDLIYQVQSACDYVKAGAGWLTGQAPPRHEDTEQTIDELRARVEKTLVFARSVAEADYAGAAERQIGLPWAPGKTIAD